MSDAVTDATIGPCRGPAARYPQLDSRSALTGTDLHREDMVILYIAALLLIDWPLNVWIVLVGAAYAAGLQCRDLRRLLTAD